MTAKEILDLKQERATLTASIRGIMDQYKDAAIPADKTEELAKCEARFDEINNSIIREEKQLERERAIGETSNKTAPATDRSVEIRNAFINHMRDGNANTFAVYNALQQSHPSQAGYLVAPEQFVSELIKGIDDTVFMRQKAKVLPALQGAQSLGYPTRTARMGAAVWGTEIAAPTADSTLAFGKREFKPNPATAEILISNTLIRNAANTDGIIRDEMAYVFGALQENAFMTGNGAGRPLGVFIASDDGIGTARDVSTGNTATEIKFDGLMEAKYAVKGQYQGAAEWIFHRDAVKKIAKLKDSDGQYIWQPSVVMNTPDMLLGKPVNQSEYAPNTFTTGLYVGLYGDLKYYWICDSLAMEIKVLAELYARTNQIDYIARIETDGAPVLAEAFARVKLA